MKRYLSAIFLVITALLLIFGLRIDTQWSGIVTWGLAFLLLIAAAYFTKYIPNEKKKSDAKE
ncbi:hypothetical protein DX933_00995 [Ornithinibacillus gellani]|uniref:hypothetical protein n=1 Tax=Ornithinibacillus gellani TaxID=2293253 RepID=UPI000F46BD06|nr:hypothetical protein [Ornithinibacillus gellani]TQS76450.1 hypothetical protein DX933_00995 [Ornithinibacillus gellani]